MSDLPGTRKLPQQPIFPEKLDPKIERVMRWQWEEIARYINTLAVAVPFTDNNFNGNYEISTGGGVTELPLGNYNNFADLNEWWPIPSIHWNMNVQNGNLFLNRNGAAIAGTGVHIFAGLKFVPKLTADANGNLTIRLRLANLQCNNNTASFPDHTAGIGMYLSAAGNVEGGLLGITSMAEVRNDFNLNRLTIVHDFITNTPAGSWTINSDLEYNSNNVTPYLTATDLILTRQAVANANNYAAAAAFTIKTRYKSYIENNYANSAYVGHTGSWFYDIGGNLYLLGHMRQNVTVISGSITEFEVIEGKIFR